MATITKVMSPLAAEAWHATLSQTDGRDKLIRLLQYVCKLLRALQAGRQPPQSGSMASTASTIESALSASRQITRLFKWTSVYAKGKPRLAALRTGSFTTRKLTELLALLTDVCLFSYYALDNLAFASKMGLPSGPKPKPSKLSQRGNRFWFVAITSSLLASLLRMHALHTRAVLAVRAVDDLQQARARQKRSLLPDGPLQEDGQEASAVEECRDIAGRQNDVLLTMLRQAADALVAGSLGWDFGAHPAFVGACGSVSSAISLFQLWPRQ